MAIDWKYKIKAVNPCSGNEHTEDDGILFLAQDKAVLVMLKAYHNECERIGAGEAHLEAIRLLYGRVQAYQESMGAKVPDTDLPCEIDRCVNGAGVS